MAVFQNKDSKKWSFRVYLEIDQHGNKKQFTRTGYDSKKDAIIAEADFIAFKEYDKKNNSLEKVTFIAAYENFKVLKKRQLKETTFINLFYLLDKHILNYFTKLNVEYINQINYKTANKFYEYLNTKNYSITHKNKLLGNFKQMIKYCNVIYDLDISFIVNIPQFKDNNPVKKTKEIYSTNDIKKLVSGAETLQDKLIINLLYYGALRLGELRALQWCDIDFENESLKITKSVSSKIGKGTFKIYTPKTKAGTRTVYIPKDLITDLKKIYDELQANEKDKASQFIIGDIKPLGESTIRRKLEQVSAVVGLKYLPPHNYRHSYITNMLLSGKVDIKVLSIQVGHDSFKTTLDIYTHLNKNEQKTGIKNALERLYNQDKTGF